MTETTAQDVTPRQDTITLKNGRKMTLSEPTLLDFRDFEKLAGKSWFEMSNGSEMRMSMTELGILIWCLIRKDGVSEQDQIAGKWAITLEEFLINVDNSSLTENKEKIGGFLAPDGPIQDG